MVIRSSLCSFVLLREAVSEILFSMTLFVHLIGIRNFPLDYIEFTPRFLDFDDHCIVFVDFSHLDSSYLCLSGGFNRPLPAESNR